MVKERLLLWLIAIVAIAGIMQIPPVSQDLTYHSFADHNALFLGISNTWNVLSNLPFVLVGMYSLYVARKYKDDLFCSGIYKQFIVFSIGVFLVGFGSAYYHYEPNNLTLIWDRLPMTIAFMSLYSIIISAFIGKKSGNNLFPWLLVCGFISVIYWAITESLGAGDLRMYALVQFLPMILMAVILYMFKSVSLNKGMLLMTMFWYGVAKAFETFDGFVYQALGESMSGHSLKHVAAAIACAYIIKWCTNEKLLSHLRYKIS